MIKVIKFRAWYRKYYEDQKMVYGDDVPVNNFLMNTDENEQSDYIFMQYANRKDKHKKEIYEGDIVFIRGHVYKVFYDDYSMSWRILMRKSDSKNLGHDKLCGSLAFNTTIEIIGNIYENPELLKEK